MAAALIWGAISAATNPGCRAYAPQESPVEAKASDAISPRWTPSAHRSAPTFTTAAETYSGISGPGGPVTGDGVGGWRSGREGLRYSGPHPKKGWQIDWDAKQTSSDQIISAGLLPALRPIWEVHMRDTSIRRGGDGAYYMTGSTGDNVWDRNDGIEVWRSKDLQDWRYLGVVWDVDGNGTWQRDCRHLRAPEIHFIRGDYFIAYSMSGCAAGVRGGLGLLKSSTRRPDGPYVDATATGAPLSEGSDATLFEDDDGEVYFTWGRGTRIHRMNEELSAFADDGRDVAVSGESLERAKQPGNADGAFYEGVSLFKRQGTYYLSGAVFIGGIDRKTGRNGRYSSAVMTSQSLYGPYSHWHEAVPGGGGGNFFQDRTRWFATLFGNDESMPFREKPGVVAIDFDTDGMIAVASDQPAFALRAQSPTRWRNVPARQESR